MRHLTSFVEEEKQTFPSSNLSSLIQAIQKAHKDKVAKSSAGTSKPAEVQQFILATDVLKPKGDAAYSRTPVLNDLQSSLIDRSEWEQITSNSWELWGMFISRHRGYCSEL